MTYLIENLLSNWTYFCDRFHVPFKNTEKWKPWKRVLQNGTKLKQLKNSMISFKNNFNPPFKGMTKISGVAGGGGRLPPETYWEERGKENREKGWKL